MTQRERVEKIVWGLVDPHEFGFGLCECVADTITAAIEAERERCAKIVNDARGTSYDLRGIAAAIRAGEP